MVRRLTAAAVLLAAVMLLHFGVLHHGVARVVFAAAPVAAEYDSRKLTVTASGVRSQQAPTAHEQSGDPAAMRPSRDLCPAAPPASADATAGVGLGTLDGPSCSGTARESHAPSSGMTPALSTLQIFRC
ncbi:MULTISPECIES: hypothetical protein [unclassified Streptomyces]|uniref:hypothetical protein n=1 Tax=unclassified Streptomyces TaxID=2593676 RepID=UPI002E80AC32|nr:hypothetical protein [Streptomyces sp. NBC_00589]WTI35033.1 hypothetical protein OIC96_08545 [Streptomyces sp. NBC_00775]WUB31293.1 hypothetical protein OHA51_41185 [Streptomyces sp. NBC_00589]